MSETRCYMLITAKIHDRDAFIAGYAQATAPLVEKFGGRYVMRAPGAELLEGEFGQGASIAISEWPDKEAAKAFWTSPEYAEAKKLREGCAICHVTVIEAPKIGD